MLDDTQTPEKTTLTPKQIDPTPICTLMSDRSLRLEDGVKTNPLQLQSLLLSGAQALMLEAVNRALIAERVLVSIREKFNGLDPETEAAIAQLVGQ